jgi:hypothetical protein
MGTSSLPHRQSELLQARAFPVRVRSVVALKHLYPAVPDQDWPRLAKRPVVDTNAHQSNGTADRIRPWPWAHLLEL